MSHSKKKINIIISLLLTVFCAIMGVMIVYRQDLITKLDLECQANIKNFTEQENLRIFNDIKKEQSADQSVSQDDNIFDSFVHLYENWEEQLASANYYESISSGYADCSISASAAGVPANINQRQDLKIVKQKAKGDTYMSFALEGEPFLGISTSFSNEYYYNASENMCKYRQVVAYVCSLTPQEFKNKFKYTMPDSLYTINENTIQSSDICYISDSKQYMCTVSLNPKTAPIAYANFLHNSIEINNTVSFNYINLKFIFNEKGVLQKIDVDEQYVLSIENFNGISGKCVFTANYVEKITAFNKKVMISAL